MSVISEVKQKTDIVEVISQYTTLTKAGRTFRALCPFHSEKHPSFFVYPEQQSWHCFGACNTGGDVFSFIMKKQGLDFGEALRLLAQKAGVTLPSKFAPEGKKDEKERLYQANEAAAQYFHNLLVNSSAGEKARNYLASRGLIPKSITDFQLGFSLDSWEALQQYLVARGYTESELVTAGLVVEAEGGKRYDRFRQRLIFPISDARGRLIGFGARALDDSLPKYINSPQTSVFDKSATLYGLNMAASAIRQQNSVVIVEGYLDVIIAHQYGFNNVVASMGTSVTDKQIGTMKRLTKNVTLALDSDAAGEEAMLRCMGYENSLEAEVKVVILPQGKDPDDVIKEDVKIWQHLLAEAVPVIDYTFNMVMAKLDLTTARDKRLAADKLLPIIAGIRDTIRQGHYLEKLARLVGVSERRLEAELGKMKPGRSQQLRPEIIAQVARGLVSSPIEEYCLALLLQHSELKAKSDSLLPEYFENSENREIFVAYRRANEVKLMREELDGAFHDYFDSLLKENLPATQIEQKFSDCALRLREKFLRGLATKKAAALAAEAEVGGTAAALAKQKEQGTEESRQLKEVLSQKARRGRGSGR